MGMGEEKRSRKVKKVSTKKNMIDLKRFLEPVGSLIDLPLVSRHAAETEVTYKMKCFSNEYLTNDCGMKQFQLKFHLRYKVVYRWTTNKPR